MNKSLFVIVLLAGACSPHREQIFSRIQVMDLHREQPYSVSCYKDYLYYIDYDGNKYICKAHQDSVALSEVRRNYSEHEIDSLHIHLGQDQTTPVSYEGPLIDTLTMICSTFKTIRQICQRDIYIESITVDSTKSAWLCLRVKPYRKWYLLLVTDNFAIALNSPPECFLQNEYRMINPSLYYRIIHRN